MFRKISQKIGRPKTIRKAPLFWRFGNSFDWKRRLADVMLRLIKARIGLDGGYVVYEGFRVPVIGVTKLETPAGWLFEIVLMPPVSFETRFQRIRKINYQEFERKNGCYQHRPKTPEPGSSRSHP